MIKIIQFSRNGCPPCRLAKTAILAWGGINYEYVDIDLRNFTEEQRDVFKQAREKNLKSLPIIAKIADDKVTFYENPVRPKTLKEFVYGE